MFSKTKDQTTVAYKLSNQNQRKIIEQLGEKYGINFLQVETLSGENDFPLLRVTKKHLYLEHKDLTLFFHPSMALLRMINIKRGVGDRFLEAVSLKEGDTILDATMGLASDALIASWAVGKRGKVIAVEYSPLIYLLVQDGLDKLKELAPGKIKNREKEEAWLELAKASSRIEPVWADHQSILEGLPDSSVDVVYFDPMFRATITSSSSMKPIKEWSYPEPLKRETIQQACRVARKRIVLKERRYGGEFERLGFMLADGSKYSSIGFGIIDLT